MRFLQLRVRWSSVADWAPVLAAAWADWDIDDQPARRRRWALKVRAGDGQVGRDGGVQPLTGRQRIAALWAAWQAGTPIAFRDVDYDADPVERTVTILDIEETVAKPADAGGWGDSVLALTLAEA